MRDESLNLHESGTRNSATGLLPEMSPSLMYDLRFRRKG